MVTLQLQQGLTARLIADHSTEFVVGLVRRTVQCLVPQATTSAPLAHNHFDRMRAEVRTKLPSKLYNGPANGWV